MILLLGEYEVHHPATADVVHFLPAVGENPLLVAPCLLQSIGQDGQAIARMFFVDGLRHEAAGPG
jgi:hypothetical protein